MSKRKEKKIEPDIKALRWMVVAQGDIRTAVGDDRLTNLKCARIALSHAVALLDDAIWEERLKPHKQ